jgi:hypothetical protein
MKHIVPEVFTWIIFSCMFENHNTLFYSDAHCMHKHGSGLRKIGHEGDSHVRYEVLMVVTIMSTIIWDMMLCSSLLEVCSH